MDLANYIQVCLALISFSRKKHCILSFLKVSRVTKKHDKTIKRIVIQRFPIKILNEANYFLAACHMVYKFGKQINRAQHASPLQGSNYCVNLIEF